MPAPTGAEIGMIQWMFIDCGLKLRVNGANGWARLRAMAAVLCTHRLGLSGCTGRSFHPGSPLARARAGAAAAVSASPALGPRPGAASQPSSDPQVMLGRVHARHRHIGIAVGIPCRIELARLAQLPNRLGLNDCL